MKESDVAKIMNCHIKKLRFEHLEVLRVCKEEEDDTEETGLFELCISLTGLLMCCPEICVGHKAKSEKEDFSYEKLSENNLHFRLQESA